MALIAYGSVKSSEAVDTKASTAWVITSIPVAAVIFGGMVAGILMSRRATSGTKSG